ncbi:myosin-1 [Cercophora scortea]|uniref:Myosin-1 n=1 Tax=Cercophora scortea TaxID=314031 RepID=A0AAE0J519_9PEZI|nr:myosin-1 [Cercophora scortea]
MGITRRAKDKAARADGSAGGAGGKASSSAKPKKATFDTSKKKQIGVSDLTLLSKVSNESINENLKKRFEGAEIYTYIGHVLVSVNPFRDLGIYTDQVLDSYRGKNRLEMPPHVFAIAESAYYNMKAYKENQCVIISGESGAGKTEAAKRIMQYIANVSGGEGGDIQQIKDMVLATNPLLESFGNAKTLRNNNSSRFGKYLQIHFNGQGEPIGADITNYLLEKSRVVSQIANERNFHIFYQFTKGASQHYRETFGIQKPETYIYTSRSKCLNVDGIDDLAEYEDTLNAMKIIGLSQAEQDNIFRMLSAILWTGNLVFREDDSGYAAVSDQSVVDFLAYLLEVDPSDLVHAITIRILTPRSGEVIESPANVAQATATRDALAKAIYSNLFDWIAAANSVGILDIYGFEIFEKNSFEQLCINYVNEKLQQIFIQLTLKAEQEEYAREKIKWTPITYFDNKIVCDLIESDATKTAHADPAACDRTFMQSMNGMSNAHLTPRQGGFIVKHYAGDVTYTVEGITDKNKDLLLKGLLNLIEGSQNRFVHAIFPNHVDQDNRKQPPSAGDRIRTSANALVETLMKCTPSYIRTIKPNENKSSSEYNVPNENSFEKFVDRFFLLSPATSYAGEYTWQGSYEAAEWQLGTLFALEHMRDRYWHNMATRIQRMWRAYLAYRAEKKRVGAEYLQLRDQGHQVLQGRKERRRMSILGSRRSGPGAQIRSAIGLGSNEKTHKFGRSSKPSPRIIIVTNNKYYIVAQMLVQGHVSIVVERSFPLGAIKFTGTSTSRDDWFSLGVGSPQEPDPLLNCLLKTEMFTQMQRVMPGGFNLKIAESIEYAKKPGKMALVKVIKDAPTPHDFYKSSTIHTQQGEPPNSISRPTPKGKPVPPRPITRGKLIRPGGPGGRPARNTTTSRTPQPRPSANSSSAATSSRPVPQPPRASQGRAGGGAAAALASQIGVASHTRQQSSSSVRAPPPPPPAAPAAKPKIMAKVLYDFAGQKENEMSITKGEVIEIVQKENNGMSSPPLFDFCPPKYEQILTKSTGWWLAQTSQGQAWVPAAYVEEQVQAPPPPVVAPRPPPPPPLNGGGGGGSDSSRSNTPTPSLAGSLADALLARKNAMAKRDDDDGW